LEAELIPERIQAAETQAGAVSEVVCGDTKADALKYIYLERRQFLNDALLVGKNNGFC